MNVPSHVAKFWSDFQQTLNEDASDRFYEAFHFDDNERSANALVELVLSGTKRATAGLLWSFESFGKPIPKAGDLSVVTNWGAQPLCIIETIRVDVVPYEEVSAQFALTEGEGDKSLRYWREAHWAYFGRECERIGREPSLQMPVVCEEFRVVFPKSN